MGNSDILGSFEQLVLLALLRIGEESYGVSIRQELEETSQRTISLGAVYSTLERLEKKGLITSRHSSPDPVRGGKPRRHFKVLPEGELALGRSRDVMDKMWHGVSVSSDRAS